MIDARDQKVIDQALEPYGFDDPPPEVEATVRAIVLSSRRPGVVHEFLANIFGDHRAKVIVKYGLALIALVIIIRFAALMYLSISI
jgi:hypothetical protein